jgi:hypothetical protein
MSVYVDAPDYPYGRMMMCHMLADTPAELHEMAFRIGIARRWYQSRASAPHYDIAKTKRALAVSYGAIEIDRKQLVAFLKKIKANWPRTAGGWE